MDPNARPYKFPSISGYSGREGDCYGHEIWDDYRATSDLESCKRICDDNPDCGAFLLRGETACFPMEKDCKTPFVHDPTDVLYTKRFPTVAGYSGRRGSCWGFDIQELVNKESDLESCKAACDGHQWCKGFVLYEGKECWPKWSLCDKPDLTWPNFVLYTGY